MVQAAGTFGSDETPAIRFSIPRGGRAGARLWALIGVAVERSRQQRELGGYQARRELGRQTGTRG